MFPLTQVIINGLLFSLAFGLIVGGSLRWNPRVWMQDFPEAIRATQPPLTENEKRQKSIVGIVFFVVLLGLPILFNSQIRAAMGEAFTFQAAFISTWIMFQMANLFDAVVLDWLYIVVLKPRHLILPGTEAIMQRELSNTRWHITNYLKGVVIVSVLALPIAAIALL